MKILLLLPYFLFGFYLSRLFFRIENTWKALALTPAFVLVLVLLAVGLCSRLLGNMPRGLYMASGLTVWCGLGLWYFEKRRGTKLPWKWDLPQGFWFWTLSLLGLVSTVLIGWTAFHYSFHDEYAIQGHAGVIESILRGPYPPRYISFPSLNLKYHFGFNLLASVTAYIFSASAMVSIDIVTVFSWMAGFSVLVLLLRSCGLSFSMVCLGVLFILFSGGLVWVVGPYLGIVFTPWQDNYLGGIRFCSHFISYFFQHPVGIGFPIFLFCLVVLHRAITNHSVAMGLSLGLLLGALSLAQVMFFSTFMAAFGIWILSQFKSKLFFGLIVGGVAVGTAFLLGGFFDMAGAHTVAGKLLFSWPPGYIQFHVYGNRPDSGSMVALLWYFLNFGFTLILFPIGLFLAWRKRNPLASFLAIFALIALLVPQFFHYTLTSDINKWFIGFELSARILEVLTLGPLIQQRIWTYFVAWPLALAGSITPLQMLKDWTLGIERGHRLLRTAQTEPDPLLGEILGKWKGCRDCRGTVWSTKASSLAISNHLGFPMVQLDAMVRLMPVPLELLTTREMELSQFESHPSVDQLKSWEVRWVIFSCREFSNMTNGLKEFFSSFENTSTVLNLSQRRERECWKVYDLKSLFH